MKERPILFNGAMVRALLDGSKTQTRRIVKPRKDRYVGCELAAHELAGEVNDGDYTNCTYGEPGDRLWVRETWLKTNPWGDHHTYGYRASDEAEFPDAIWKPSIHMPRVASRITLEIVSVRVERLQDISETDAIAEGIDRQSMFPWRPDEILSTNAEVSRYAVLWESINGPGSWDANPWVWVVEFEIAKDTK